MVNVAGLYVKKKLAAIELCGTLPFFRNLINLVHCLIERGFGRYIYIQCGLNKDICIGFLRRDHIRSGNSQT